MTFPMQGDNFRVVAGPISKHQALSFVRPDLPEAVCERIRAYAGAGHAPGKIAQITSTCAEPVTKNAVLRVLAGGKG